MKINEYNSMMSYLTRPAKVLGNNINDKKINPTGARTALKRGSSDTKPTPKNNKMLQYIDDYQIVYDGKEATKSEIEAAAKRIDSYKKKMSKQDIYNTYFNKKSPKYYKAEKPKPNGTTTFTSDDWDLIINNTEFPHEMFDDSWTKNKAGILEYELSQEYWLEQYDNYINQGGMLSFKEFMQQQNNMKVSRAIDNRVKEKMKTEGIAQILSLPLDKI